MSATGPTQGGAPAGRRVSQSSPIVRTGVEWIFHTALVFSVFVFFAAHRSPGGGFAAGLVGGIALVLRSLSLGPHAPQATVAVAPTVLVGSGLTLAAGTGAAAMAMGRPFLSSVTLHAELPLVGAVEASSTLLFEAGIYVIVMGVVLMLLHTVGRAQEPKQ